MYLLKCLLQLEKETEEDFQWSSWVQGICFVQVRISKKLIPANLSAIINITNWSHHIHPYTLSTTMINMVMSR